ncbi:MAG: AgmX/PglI C-terminal domain-containing protein [Myxococcota bacterium]
MTSQPTTNPFRHPALLFTAATAASSVVATSMALWLAPTPQAATCPDAEVVAEPEAPAVPTSQPPERPGPTGFDAEPGMDKSIIRRIVRAHINEVRFCYNNALASDPDTAGRVSVQFTIGTEGIVTASDVADNTTGDVELGACVAKAAMRWHYPKPSDGESVVVTYPFVLAPG